MSGHTPGPYRADVMSGGYIHAKPTAAHAAKYPENRWVQVGHVCSFAEATPAEVYANLQLFAAAPDLLAALSRVAEFLEANYTAGDMPDILPPVRAALIKAGVDYPHFTETSDHA